jgi:hypothetical protein
LTFQHIEDKELAVKNIFASMKIGGYFILSISNKTNYWLDYGSRRVRLFPQSKEHYLKMLNDNGFVLEFEQETESGFATIIKAKKV